MDVTKSLIDYFRPDEDLCRQRIIVPKSSEWRPLSSFNIAPHQCSLTKLIATIRPLSGELVIFNTIKSPGGSPSPPNTPTRPNLARRLLIFNPFCRAVVSNLHFPAVDTRYTMQSCYDPSRTLSVIFMEFLDFDHLLFVASVFTGGMENSFLPYQVIGVFSLEGTTTEWIGAIDPDIFRPSICRAGPYIWVFGMVFSSGTIGDCQLTCWDLKGTRFSQQEFWGGAETVAQLVTRTSCNKIASYSSVVDIRAALYWKLYIPPIQSETLKQHRKLWLFSLCVDLHPDVDMEGQLLADNFEEEIYCLDLPQSGPLPTTDVSLRCCGRKPAFSIQNSHNLDEQGFFVDIIQIPANDWTQVVYSVTNGPDFRAFSHFDLKSDVWLAHDRLDSAIPVRNVGFGSDWIPVQSPYSVWLHFLTRDRPGRRTTSSGGQPNPRVRLEPSVFRKNLTALSLRNLAWIKLLQYSPRLVIKQKPFLKRLGVPESLLVSLP